MKLNFLIIGAQKSATTFVQNCLADHPQVFIPKKEVPYFEDPDYSQQSWQDFTKTFASAKTGQIKGLKRGTILTRPETVDRLYKHAPQAKLIVILRNPIDRSVSAYFHYIKTGLIPPVSLNQGLNAILSNKYSKKYPSSPEIIEFGYYSKYLSKFLAKFPRRQIHIVLYRDLRENPQRVIKQIYRFLDIDSSFIPPSLNSKPQKGIYSMIPLKIHYLGNYFRYVYNQDKTRLYKKNQSLFDRVMLKLLNACKKVAFQLWPDHKPHLHPKQRQILFDLYKTDMQKLEKIINKDLGHWQ